MCCRILVDEGRKRVLLIAAATLNAGFFSEPEAFTAFQR